MNLWFAIIKARWDIAGVVMWTKNSHSPRRTSGLSAFQPHETCWVLQNSKLKDMELIMEVIQQILAQAVFIRHLKKKKLCLGLYDNFKQA